ncbi:MAG: Hpt domain-containing protein [Caulobacteraceae bacterium]|nr:Hpt domain-containing protein [Caulobacteraceae bacterium]
MTDPLAPLRARFRLRAAEDLTRLQALRQAGDAAELRRLAHGISGAAGTFGFPDLSEAAGRIDDDYVAGQTPTSEAFARLERALEAAAASGD